MLSELDSHDSDSTTTTASEATASRSSSLATALWCAEQRWPVHPLAPRRKTPAANCRTCRVQTHRPEACACIRDGRWCHGFHAATTDAGRIRSWWAGQPGFGVGVACGPAGLVVIDIDTHDAPLPSRQRLLPGIPIAEGVSLRGLHNGFHSLALLAALRGAPDPAEDTSTLRVRTPSGGMHIWYAAGSDHDWRGSAGSSPGRALAWQVDVRAHGGYIIAPGTTTAAGAYTAVGTTQLPARLPAWLAGELARTGHRPAPAEPRSSASALHRAREAVLAAGGGRGTVERLMATVLSPVRECAAATEGTGFSDKLNRAAYTAGGLVAAGHLTPAEAESALVAAAEHARPGQERRALQIIRGGLSAGSQRPFSLEGRA